MKVASFYNISLKSTCFLCGLFLLIGCSDEEIQPAQLIKASSFNAEGNSLAIDLLPLNGRGILARDSTMEFVFDKPVLEVVINYTAKAQSDDAPPATVWKLEGNQLKEVWNLQIGFNAERDVTLTIIYEDKSGLHKETLDVTLGAYSIDVFPLEIVSANVANNQIDADANRLNQEGITITFNAEMDTSSHRTKIEIYSGQTMLNWRIDWTEGNSTAVLLPMSKDNQLLPGQDYKVLLVDFYDINGARGAGLEDGPTVISFKTASEE